MMLYLRTSLALFAFVRSCLLYAQDFRLISQNQNSGLSYYDICRISDNEFWIGGEDGILKKIDTLGNISSLKFDVPAFDILKMAFRNDSVWLGGTRGNLYSYSLHDSSIRKTEFPGRFRRLCFYDLLPLADGGLLLCGGNTRIPAAAKVAPHGFILRKFPNPELKPEYLWRRWLAFAWALQGNGQDLFAAIFKVPSFKSAVICQKQNGKSWTLKEKIDGLIHGIFLSGQNIYYFGSASIKYAETGIAGNLNKGSAPWTTNNSGCVFDLKTNETFTIGCDYAGNILNFIADRVKSIFVPNASFYELHFITPTRVMAVGKHETIVLTDLK